MAGFANKSAPDLMSGGVFCRRRSLAAESSQSDPESFLSHPESFRTNQRSFRSHSQSFRLNSKSFCDHPRSFRSASQSFRDDPQSSGATRYDSGERRNGSGLLRSDSGSVNQWLRSARTILSRVAKTSPRPLLQYPASSRPGCSNGRQKSSQRQDAWRLLIGVLHSSKGYKGYGIYRLLTKNRQ